MSAIIFCADLDSNCVSVNDVRPWMTVAVRTASTIGVSNRICFWPITLSIRYFVDAGNTNPERRLIAMSTKPSANNPRRGFISAQTSGRLFHAFLRFSLLDGDLTVVSVAMIGGRKYTPAIRCRWWEEYYIGESRREGTAILSRPRLPQGARWPSPDAPGS